MGAAMAVNGEIRAAVASPAREWLAWSAAVVEDPAAAGWNCWDHEPVRIPLSRPSATLSPAQSGGEGRERGRFMESPHGFDAVHWHHEPVWVVPSVWCPAFRRPGPAKAGTPNRRFMERLIIHGKL